MLCRVGMKAGKLSSFSHFSQGKLEERHLFLFSFFTVTVLVKKKKRNVVVIKPDFTGLKRSSQNKRLDVHCLFISVSYLQFSFTLIFHLLLLHISAISPLVSLSLFRASCPPSCLSFPGFCNGQLSRVRECVCCLSEWNAVSGLYWLTEGN